MPRPKIARKTPTVDMTAMCDVAFLLLSFFILATQLKPDEAVPVTTPNSVANKEAPAKDVVLVTLNSDGKAYLSIQDEDKKATIIETVNKDHHLGLSGGEVNALVKQLVIAVPIASLKQQAAMPAKNVNASLPGIPVADSANNEMKEWIKATADAYFGSKMNLLVKGDNVAKYPQFRNIVNAFKANDLFQFQLVTNPEAVPVGSLLWKSQADKDKKF